MYLLNVVEKAWKLGITFFLFAEYVFLDSNFEESQWKKTNLTWKNQKISWHRPIGIYHQSIPLDWLTWRLQSYFQTIVHTPHGTHMMGAQGMMGPAIAGSGPPLPVRPLLAAPAAHHQQTVAASVVPPPSLPPPPTKYQVPVLFLAVFLIRIHLRLKTYQGCDDRNWEKKFQLKKNLNYNLVEFTYLRPP
jgi:hypothetical protein